MAKSQDAKKNVKKEAVLTPKEKKAAKMQRKRIANSLSHFDQHKTTHSG